jgi:hypothetical protein
MRTLAVVAGLLLAGCITAFPPRDLALYRGSLTAPVIGCAPVDTVVPVMEPGTLEWPATCGGKAYNCRGLQGGAQFTVVCEPAIPGSL